MVISAGTSGHAPIRALPALSALELGSAYMVIIAGTSGHAPIRALPALSALELGSAYMVIIAGTRGTDPGPACLVGSGIGFSSHGDYCRY